MYLWLVAIKLLYRYTQEPNIVLSIHIIHLILIMWSAARQASASMTLIPWLRGAIAIGAVSDHEKIKYACDNAIVGYILLYVIYFSKHLKGIS